MPIDHLAPDGEDNDVPSWVRRRWNVHLAPDAGEDFGADLDLQRDVLVRWHAQRTIDASTPFLLDPDAAYDDTLNAFFFHPRMLVRAPRTKIAYAHDLARFLTFLLRIGSGRRIHWSEVNEEHRRAYFIWRNQDPMGPRVAASTWNREVASLSMFYEWAMGAAHVEKSPMSIIERPRRKPWMISRHQYTSHSSAETRPDSRVHRIEWMSARMYRQWRDTGLRGFTSNGVPDPSFQGLMSGRNACFSDLMIRTGMRLREQATLSMFELPGRDGNAYVPAVLPGSQTKNRVPRRIYYPNSVLMSLDAYIRGERSLSIRIAQERGDYILDSHTFIFSPETQAISLVDGSLTKLRLASLREDERARTYSMGPNGPEPVALWLTVKGTPLSPHTWQTIFRNANRRCSQQGIAYTCHPHLLRHSFAVITLEQLQRGHIQRLSEMSENQRRSYTMVFGDPLDWVRRLMGHRSLETTHRYLHVLAELEYETRMSLINDDWEVPSSEMLNT